MTRMLRALALVVLAPLVLASCLFVPGKFDSALTIHRDRSFTFTYKGEVVALDLKGLGGDFMKIAEEEGGKKGKNGSADPTKVKAAEQAKRDEEYRKLAVELAKEAGYRSVEYRGNGIFYVDFALSGVLDHAFVYPYNQDNEIILPWIAIELRGKDAVRVKAQGFARQKNEAAGLGGMGGGMAAGAEAADRMEGTFTLTTDAEVISQNNEAGAETVGSDKVIAWKVDTRTKDAPMASLRVAPLR
ncbi:hypothetical protein SAMN03159338_1215 [Sphingomonas sp. NFR04]|uniref:hypothetical protein n=1 Tax=Sphingomonas sp. NFR04 TaxID=1566283 RepID=UPI0008E94B88|nr:hypothetical protein [Sphingomonas sp. NFR04]SFJ25831.1 hypothetical protein SAMN03159338_1215 [Sphingomonas sp. NFR04]